MTSGPGIAVVESGIGDPHLNGKATRRLAPGATVSVTSDPGETRRAGKVALPGDGAFGHRMGRIDRGGPREALAETARTKPPAGIRIGT